MNLPFLEEHTWHEPFVEPRERHLVDVPIQFATGEHFCKVPLPNPQREFFDDNLLVQIHFIIEMILVYRPCAMGV